MARMFQIINYLIAFTMLDSSLATHEGTLSLQCKTNLWVSSKYYFSKYFKYISPIDISPRVFFIVFGLSHGYYPTENISSCDSKANTGASTIKDIDLLLETIWRNLDDDVKDAKRSLISDRFDTNIQEYKTMAFIATGALATTHSLVCMNTSSEILMNPICNSRSLL